MQRIRYISVLLFGTLLLFMASQVSFAQERGIEFRISLNEDGETYEVYMRPSHTIETPNRTMTSQVTIKVPHATGDDRFQVEDINSIVDGTSWQATSRIDAPEEAANADYLSFTLEFPLGEHDAYEWIGDEEIKVFTFKNAGTCQGAALLIDNDDPFMAPNSASTNPGNQVDVLVLSTAEEVSYIGNYGNPAICEIDPNSRPDGQFIHLPVIRQ